MNVSSKSTESGDDVIWQANEKVFEENLPTVIYLSTLMTFAIVGNTLVVYIYSRYFRKTTGNFYVKTLAVFDIISGFMLIAEVLDRRYPMYSGQIPPLCKTVRLIEFVVNGSSMAMLICIAFDRYYKICYPMKCFTMNRAKKLLLLIIFLIILVTWPTALFHGQELKETEVPHIYGKDCADDDKYKNSKSSTAYYTFIFVIYIVSFVLLVVMYSRIYLAIWRWRKTHIGEVLMSVRRKSKESSISQNLDDKQHKVDMDVSSEKVDEKLELTQIIELDDINKEKNHITENEQSDAQNSPKLIKEQTSKENVNTASDYDNIFDHETGQNKPGNEVEENAQNTSDISNTCIATSGVKTTAGNENNLTPHEVNGLTDADIKSEQCSEDVAPCQHSKVKITDESEDMHANVNKLPGNITLNSELCEDSNNSSDTSCNSNLGLSNPAFNLQEKEIKVPQVTPQCQDKHKKLIVEPRKSKAITVAHSTVRRRSSNKSSVTMTNTTFIFCVVTVTYICAYLPYFTIEILNATGIMNFQGLSLTKIQIVRVLNSSFVLSNAINPIIYSIFNPNFRYFVKNIFTCRKPARQLSVYTTKRH